VIENGMEYRHRGRGVIITKNVCFFVPEYDMAGMTIETKDDFDRNDHFYFDPKKLKRALTNQNAFYRFEFAVFPCEFIIDRTANVGIAFMRTRYKSITIGKMY